MSAKGRAIAVTALGVVVLLFALADSSRFWLRADFSKNRRYTIAPASRNLASLIEEPLSITYYRSDKLLSMHPMPREIEDLLREFAAYGKGKIRLFFKDPAKAGLAAAVERIGIEPRQVQTVERNESTVATVYSGIEIRYLDRVEVIPFVFSLDTLEYDLTTRIRSAVLDERRAVGVLVADPEVAWNTDFTLAAQALGSAGFDVRQLAPGDEIPPSLSTLLVFGGAASLDDWDLYRIEAYLAGGGSALFAVDAVNVAYRTDLAVGPVRDSRLLSMLTSFGARVEPVLVLDPACLRLPVDTGTEASGSKVELIDYPFWISIDQRRVSRTNPITARFGGLDLFWASPVTPRPDAGPKMEVLASTSPQSWLMSGNYTVDPQARARFYDGADASRGSRAVALALSGVLPGYFDSSRKPRREGAVSGLPDLPRVRSASRAIVVGDMDFASDQLAYSNSRYNLEFLLSCIDWLSNDEAVLAIRTRGAEDLRLNGIDDEALKARAASAVVFLNVIAIPVALILYGIARARRRRRLEREGKR